eukprot:TRINITY_DN16306_c0_g1_i1.p1 TRINITY_DN16306_c0_g1~~TRINITY_DN16306_c0_g1_i1.p1  ORF type:complete len:283 (+),score=39.16 TRINITY_DN16306_c0_g1_i1:115-963(+)
MALPSGFEGLCPRHKEIAFCVYRELLAGLAVCLLLLSMPSGSEAQVDRDVYLRNMTIFQTHEWFGAPRVYFRCTDNETKVFLPDVTSPGQQYTFSNYESWQPLTTLPALKCKRCGFYEADTIKSDDVFGEWELCPLDFTADGSLSKLVEGEFMASFYCKDCAEPSEQKTPAGGLPSGVGIQGSPPGSAGMTSAPIESSSQTGTAAEPPEMPSSSKGRSKGLGAGLIVLIVFLSLLGAVGAGVGLHFFHKFLRRKRMNDHARAFDLLFDSGDELEEEMEKGRL